MDALFTAFDVAGLQAHVQTVLLIGVALTLSFTAYRFVKKVASRGL